MNEPFRYSFYVDIEANMHEASTQNALEELKSEAEEIKLFGSYPKQINAE